MNVDQLPSRKYILELLEVRKNDPPTTAEIIQHVVQQDASCKDKVPIVLRKLEKAGHVKKQISPSKKGFVWVLASTSPAQIPKK